MFVTIVKDADDESCQTLCKTLHKTKDQHTQMNKYHIKFHQWSRQCLDNRSLELNNVMTPHYDATFDSVVQKRSLFDEEDHLATRQRVVNYTDKLLVPLSFINLNVIMSFAHPFPTPSPPRCGRYMTRTDHVQQLRPKVIHQFTVNVQVMKTRVVRMIYRLILTMLIEIEHTE